MSQKRNLNGFAAATAVAAALLATATSSARADEALADLVEQVAPSVVSVFSAYNADQESLASDRFESLPFLEESPFRDFFNDFGPKNGLPEPFHNQRPQSSVGTGFILDEDGWIVTNQHVVDGAHSITVRLSDNREFDAEIIGVDALTDLALLRVETSEDLPHVELGDSDEIRVGEDVMALGNPFGLGGTVTAGIVSAKGRSIADSPYADFLQTDAAINKGNSGGPLFNMDGEVVGVNSAIYSPSGGSVGVGFAITSNIVDLIVDDLKDDGQVDRGWLGVSIQDVTPDLATALDLDKPKGALVASVVEGGPSHGKLQAGDVLLEFDGRDVPNSSALPKLVAATEAGELTTIKILRKGEITSTEVRIGEFHTAEVSAPRSADKDDATLSSLGATVAELDDDVREEVGVDKDVDGLIVTSLSETGPAAKAGLQVGDIIVRVGDLDVPNEDALSKAINTQKTDPALLLINRYGRQIFIAVEFA